MLELSVKENIWDPPYLTDSEIMSYVSDRKNLVVDWHDYIVFLKKTPFIDLLFVRENDSGEVEEIERFVFHDDHIWDFAKNERFRELCIDNERINYDRTAIDEIYRYYSGKYPGWRLKRYHTKDMRLLDHIYNCMRKNTVKELLYKAELDELAALSDDIDHIDLLSGSPAEIYGMSNRIIRAVNCKAGAEMMNVQKYRRYLKKLNAIHPDVFSQPLNNAQCRYLRYLIDGDLIPAEAGRLYLARREDLRGVWCSSLYDLFLNKYVRENDIKAIKAIDPIYAKYLTVNYDENNSLATLKHYLLGTRKEFDRDVRRSNRKREYEWQERDNGYVVRYPQTVNDFCREAIYMSNCLLAYFEAYIKNDTTILFMRKVDDFNKPFITIEVYNNRLMQAYHRFNTDCTAEEADWIRAYCERHGIDASGYSFNAAIDVLM